MTEEEQFEQIERYINQELSDKEMKEFEQLINNDTALAQEVSLHQEMTTFLSDNQAFELEEKLALIGEEFSIAHKKNTNPTISRKWSYWIAAASFLIISTFAWWYSQMGGTNEALFATHYETYISDELERSNPQEFSSLLKTGLNAYSQKEYQVAIDQFQQALQMPNSPNNSHESILFHLAMGNLELKKYALAKDYLKQILALNQSVYTQQAYWYSALIELKEGNSQNSKIALEKLLSISDKGKYALQAKKLLQQL